MYVRYAERHGLEVELLAQNENEAGGMKEAIFKVSGGKPYGQLKFEGGVHRVQRVPVTESQGRIHTSTATVAVLPEAAEEDLEIRPEDLRIDIYRSGGHGGQGVNTTDLAVDISEEALSVARENAEKLGAEVEFQRSDLTEGVDNLEDFGLVVANLPYVDESWEWIDRRALGFEPRLALFAEEAGLGVYRRLLDELVERGWRGKIVLEADKCQEEGLKRLAEERKMRFESAKLLTNMITCAIMER